MDTEAKLRTFSLMVRAHFLNMAEVAGLTIDPIVNGNENILLTGRIYEEVRGYRRFFIELSDRPGLGLDAFVKQTGANFEISMLKVLTDPSEQNIPVLWDIYLAWFYGLADERDIIELIKSAEDGVSDDRDK